MRTRKPSYPLKEVRKLIDAGKSVMTQTAVKGAHGLGFSETEALGIVRSLRRADFRKSETDYHNHRVWQDYYKTRARGTNLFLKLKIVRNPEEEYLLVLSFKRDTGEEFK